MNELGKLMLKSSDILNRVLHFRGRVQPIPHIFVDEYEAVKFTVAEVLSLVFAPSHSEFGRRTQAVSEYLKLGLANSR